MRHIHVSRLAAVLATGLLLVTGPALAGDLTGRVVDNATGGPLSTATVRIRELNRSVNADRSGAFRITDLPAGVYTVEASFVGFDPVQVAVTVPESGTIEQRLALAATGTTAEVLVVGFRLQQAQSLQSKKASSVIQDSVTSDEAGKLPDQNAAEALGRIPGVSVANDQGEGRYVTVRGIDAALNNVTLDGAILGSPEDQRRIALDTVPTNLLAKLEVIKTATPDLDGNSIGATINLITPSAFDDPDGRFFAASADLGYYDLNEDVPYGASAAWGSVFGDDKWGIVLSASYLNREYGSENLQGGDPWEEEGDFFVPDEFVLRDYEIERIRTGFVANLEFRPDDDTQFYFRNLYNLFRDTELQPETIFDYRNGDLTDQTPTSGTFSAGEAQRANSRRVEKQSIQSSTLGAVIRRDLWTISPAITVGKAEQDTPYDREWVFATDGDDNPSVMDYDTSRRLFRVTADEVASDATLFEFDEYLRGSQLIEEDLLVGQADAQREFLWNDNPGFLKFGAKYVSREKTSDQDAVVYDGIDDLDLFLSDVSRPGRSDFYRSEGGFPFGPQVDFRAVETFFAENSAAFEVNDADTAAESFGVDYRIDESVTSAYLMGSLEVGPATFIGGVRVERTDVDFDAFDIQFAEVIDPDDPDETIETVVTTPVTGDKSYTNWLPSLQMRYELQENLLIRAAWTNTLGRPSYEINAPFRLFEIEEVDDGEFEGAIEAGNPELEAQESMGLDLGVEWFTESGGILAAGIFYKDIDKPIYTRIQELEEVDFEGRFYTELEIEQAQNARSGEILGLELNLQQQFRTLPAPFDGLGIAVTYTYTDAEATVFDREDKLPFFLQSEHIANLAVFYERSGLEMRLAYTYRSEYLDTVGEDAFTDLYVASHGQLDFKTSYAFTDTLTGSLQFQNLTDEPLRLFSGESNRVAENERYGWNAMAGVQIKF